MKQNESGIKLDFQYCAVASLLSGLYSHVSSCAPSSLVWGGKLPSQSPLRAPWDLGTCRILCPVQVDNAIQAQPQTSLQMARGTEATGRAIGGPHKGQPLPMQSPSPHLILAMKRELAQRVTVSMVKEPWPPEASNWLMSDGEDEAATPRKLTGSIRKGPATGVTLASCLPHSWGYPQLP